MLLEGYFIIAWVHWVGSLSESVKTGLLTVNHKSMHVEELRLVEQWVKICRGPQTTKFNFVNFNFVTLCQETK